MEGREERTKTEQGRKEVMKKGRMEGRKAVKKEGRK